jgi:hypothetical protein
LNRLAQVEPSNLGETSCMHVYPLSPSGMHSNLLSTPLSLLSKRFLKPRQSMHTMSFVILSACPFTFLPHQSQFDLMQQHGLNCDHLSSSQCKMHLFEHIFNGNCFGGNGPACRALSHFHTPKQLGLKLLDGCNRTFPNRDRSLAPFHSRNELHHLDARSLSIPLTHVP